MGKYKYKSEGIIWIARGMIIKMKLEDGGDRVTLFFKAGNLREEKQRHGETISDPGALLSLNRCNCSTERD